MWDCIYRCLAPVLETEMKKEKGDFDLTHLFENQKETTAEGETVLIKGNLPDWVQGSVFTTGPGKFHFPEKGFSVNHYIDGYAIISKLSISGNRATLWKKYEDSDALKKANAAGKTVLMEFFTPTSTDVTKSGLGRFGIIPDNSDNGNVNVFHFGDRIYSTNGALYFREIIPSDLSTGTKYDSKRLGFQGLTPRPLIDADGTMYNVGSAISATGGRLAIIKISTVKPGERFKDALKKIETVATFPMSRSIFSSVLHSFSMSEKYFVIIEQPFMINVKKFIKLMITGVPTAFIDFAEWDDEEINRFLIIDKISGKVDKRKVFSSQPFFFFHIVNSYEENDQLMVDVVAYPDISEFQQTFLNNIVQGNCCNAEANGTLKRFAIPLNDNFQGANDSSVAKLGIDGTLTLTATPMSEKGLYMNAILNPRYKFKKYQFVYGTSGFFLKGQYGRRITKIDLLTGDELAWDCGGDCIVGEPVFIPNPKGNEEDDGVLVAGVFDTRRAGKSFVVFVSALTMLEIGRAEFQNALGIYRHGIFVPSLF